MYGVKLIHETQHFLFLFVSAMALISSCRSFPRTGYPILPGHPFMFTWNAPTELCNIHFGMPLDLPYFSFVSSTLKMVTNQSISIFYIDRFDIFPYMDEDTGEMHDEGFPQMIDMQDHHDDAADDIKHYIPTNGPDLAVLDFKEWRPQWIRNWGSKDIYREVSIEKVKKKKTSLSEDEAEERAKIVFERAAKRYFVQTIQIGKKLRPKRLWGYYLYPDCYNYDCNQDMVGFTGECPDIEKQRNDKSFVALKRVHGTLSFHLPGVGPQRLLESSFVCSPSHPGSHEGINPPPKHLFNPYLCLHKTCVQGQR